jgi:peptide/nickel transport system permease protein
MIAYIARRLLLTIPILIGVTFLSFIVLHLVPGNPALVIAGVGASPEDIQRIEQALGLNRPLLDQ